MGTRGILYIYLVHKNIRFLVYATYSQHDGFDWLPAATACFYALLSSREDWRLVDLLAEYQKEYSFDDGFAADAEAIGHVYLKMADETENVKLDLANFRYVPKATSTYGYCETGTYGDCLIRPGQDEWSFGYVSEFHYVTIERSDNP